ncbi:hypothetical protein D9M71_591060 [compost metagenome]
MLQHRDGLGLIAVEVLHLAPVATIARGLGGFTFIKQTVVAVGMFERQCQQQRDGRNTLLGQAAKLHRRRQPVGRITVDQRAIRHPHTQVRGLELAEPERVQVKRCDLHAPRVGARNARQAFIGPGFPPGLLLELLRGQQGPRTP